MSLINAACNIDFGGNELAFIIVLSLTSIVLSIIFIFWISVICLIYFKIHPRDFGHDKVRRNIRGSCSDSQTLVAETKQSLDDKRVSALDSIEHHGTFRQHHQVKKEEEARYIGIDEIKGKEGASENGISVLENPNYQEVSIDGNTYDTLQGKGNIQDGGDTKEKGGSYENLAEVRGRVNTGDREGKPPKEHRISDPISKMVQKVKLKDSDGDTSPLVTPEDKSMVPPNPVYDQLDKL